MAEVDNKKITIEVGSRFKRLVIARIDNTVRESGQKKVTLILKCDCGNEVTLSPPSRFVSSNIGSCGCAWKEHKASFGERKRTHGGSSTKLYQVWFAMKKRCQNPKDKFYHDYGGRGVSVCAEWEDFAAFRAWAYSNGYAEGLQIDRFPDNNGNYEPNNCRWATSSQNNNNQRRTIRLEHDGVIRTIAEWAEVVGLRWVTIYNRLRDGWLVKDALTVKRISGSRKVSESYGGRAIRGLPLSSLPTGDGSAACRTAPIPDSSPQHLLG